MERGEGEGGTHTMDRADIRLGSALGSMICSRSDVSLISALFAHSRKRIQFTESAMSAFERVESLLELFRRRQGCRNIQNTREEEV